MEAEQMRDLSDWRQLSLRRCQNGDYLQILGQADGLKLLVRFGAPNPDGETINFTFELELNGEGVGELAADLSNASQLALKRTRGCLDQALSGLADAQQKLAARDNFPSVPMASDVLDLGQEDIGAK